MTIWIVSFLKLTTWFCNCLSLLVSILILLMLNPVVVSGECLQSLNKFLAQELWRSVSSWYLRRNFPFIILNLACWAFCKVSFWTCHYLCLGIVLEGLIKMLIRRVLVTYGWANFYSLCRHILLSVHFWIGLIVFYWTLTTFFPLWILLSITCKLNLFLLRGHHSNSFCKEF